MPDSMKKIWCFSNKKFRNIFAQVHFNHTHRLSISSALKYDAAAEAIGIDTVIHLIIRVGIETNSNNARSCGLAFACSWGGMARFFAEDSRRLAWTI
jgi:hypothetical protein